MHRGRGKDEEMEKANLKLLGWFSSPVLSMWIDPALQLLLTGGPPRQKEPRGKRIRRNQSE
jgi:hypothetical protein